MTGDAPRVIRRRRGPFKRSRTGCGTCKRRGKKCDEIWSPEGFCQRCLAGPWECTGRSPGPSSQRSDEAASAGQAQAMGMNLGSSSGVGVSAPPNALPTPISLGGVGSITPSINGSAPLTQQVSPVGGLSSPNQSNQGQSSQSNQSHRSNSGGAMPTMTSVSAVMAAASTLNGAGATAGGDGIGYLSSLWNGMVHPGQTRATQLFNTHTHTNTVTQPLFDWPGANGGTPSAVLTTMADGTLAIDTTQPHLQMGDMQDFWDDISASWSGALNTSSRVLFLNSDKPMRQGVSLAEIYARVVESWLVGLPGPTRDYARARILALHDSNSVIRGVRYAVAAAYIFLFASDPHADPQADPQPRPKLVELACRGAGIVEGVRPDTDGPNPGAAAVKKLRFYVDNVSTPFAGDIESTKWTEDAVTELRQVMVTDRRQLSDLLWGVIDLQLVEFIRGGAAPSYNMLALGDRLVRNLFGSDHPPITLSDLRSSETFSLRLYGLSDVSRCIVQRGRRTIFRFNTADEAATLPLTREDETWSTYLGLPDAIVILLAEIANLCADSPGLPPERVTERANELEAALRGWTAAPALGVDASALVSRTIAGELWRLSALVLLYQSVHRVGPFHPVLRRARAEILTLLGSVTQLPNGDLWGFIALPSFLAATLCVEEADRERVMAFLVRVGPERVWLDNIALVEKVWEEMDETGRAVDWHDKMVREGLSVAFF